MGVLVLDAGNSIIKAKIARREHGEIAFPHAFKPLTEVEYSSIVSRAGKQSSLQDYIRINGQPYVVGESAERHGVHTQRTGSSRYTRDYYGVFAAAVLGRFYDRRMEVSIFGSHPPGDAMYRDDLMKSVIGDWTVEKEGRECHFRVTYANTFDEPVGGLMNVILTEDGQHYQHTELNGGRSLVIDIGGFTTDWIAVNPGGEVDYGLARSIPAGIQNVVSDFEESFRANNRKAVKRHAYAATRAYPQGNWHWCIRRSWTANYLRKRSVRGYQPSAQPYLRHLPADCRRSDELGCDHPDRWGKWAALQTSTADFGT